jgi:hypothetical protein
MFVCQSADVSHVGSTQAPRGGSFDPHVARPGDPLAHGKELSNMSCVCPDLVDVATRAFEQHPHLLNRRGVEIRANKGRVELHGTVRSFYLKQLAQETLLRIDGVGEVDNHLVVNWA